MRPARIVATPMATAASTREKPRDRGNLRGMDAMSLQGWLFLLNIGQKINILIKLKDQTF
jgi:hypothetical protein